MTSRVGRCEGLVHDDCSLPSSLPSITYSVLWAEQTTHWDLLHTVFKWADDAQKAFFLSAGHPGTVLQKLYFERAVMRSVTVEVANSEPHAVADQVIVFSWISKVGRTSWQSSTEIRCKNQLVARAVTTMVAMDHALETTVPVPHAAELREMVQKAADVSSVEVKVPSRPSTAYVWLTVVRLTDCDSFGHVTNTKYPVMALEARAVAAKAAGYSREGQLLADLQPTGCHVDYIAQVHPLVPLEIATWFDGPSQAFIFEFVIRESVNVHAAAAATVILSTKAPVLDMKSHL